jgi:hypothetical protein
MSDADDYDPCADWVPPAKVYMDEIVVRDPELGTVPFWKSLLWNTAKARSEMIRNDSAVGASALGQEDKPPRLAADEQSPPPAIDPDLMQAIEDRIADLTARMDRYERRMAAESALLALEDEIERLSPPSDDDGEREPIFEPTIKH